MVPPSSARTFEALRARHDAAAHAGARAPERSSRRPVVIFSYLNPILRYGVDRFLRDAASLGHRGPAAHRPAGGQRPGGRAAGAARARSTSSGWSRRRRGPTGWRESVPGAQGFLYLVSRAGGHRRERRRSRPTSRRSIARVRAATAAADRGRVRDLDRRAGGARRPAGRRRGGGERAGGPARARRGARGARLALERCGPRSTAPGRRHEHEPRTRLLDVYARVLAIGGVAARGRGAAERPARLHQARSRRSSLIAASVTFLRADPVRLSKYSYLTQVACRCSWAR